jgi:addiction module HigA family antidote
MKNRISPEHVGIILLQEFIEPNSLHSDDVAQAVGISEYELKEIIEGKLDMSQTIAHKLSEFFGLSGNYFENIQKQKKS